MAKAADPVNAALRAIPSVDRILTAAPFAPLIFDFGRERVKEAVVEYLAPVRKRYDEIRQDQGALEETLSKGAEKARAIASQTVAEARARMRIGPE